MSLGKKYFLAKETSVFFGLGFLILIFSILSESFLTLDTFASIATVSTEIGLIAIGATILMIAGEFDLSVGSNFALSGMVFAMMSANFGLSSYFAFFAAIFVGLLIGLTNALITIKTKIPSFITTLGTMLVFRGLVLILTNGFPISAIENNSIMALLAFDFGFGFKSSIFVWFAAIIIFVYLLNHHRFGSALMATGGNEEAAFSMGIKTKRVKIISFLITGALASFAGVIQFSHLMSLSPTAGEQYELRAIAIAVIGGSALNGGSGTIWGTFLATIIMGVLASGLVQAGVSTYWFRTLVGVILVLAVVMNTSINQLKEKAA